MRKTFVWVPLILLVAVSTAFCQPEPKFGVGAYGGLSIPILQDDQGSGTAFGFKVRYGLGQLFVLEPNINFDKWGKPGTVEGVDLGIDGSKVTSIGLDLVLGNAPGAMGVHPYFSAGLGSFKIKNEDTGYEESKIGYTAGLGLGVGLTPKFGLDFRGKFLIAPQEEGSKKGLSIVGGLNFNFGASE